MKYLREIANMASRVGKDLYGQLLTINEKVIQAYMHKNSQTRDHGREPSLPPSPHPPPSDPNPLPNLIHRALHPEKSPFTPPTIPSPFPPSPSPEITVPTSNYVSDLVNRLLSRRQGAPLQPTDPSSSSTSSSCNSRWGFIAVTGGILIVCSVLLAFLSVRDKEAHSHELDLGQTNLHHTSEVKVPGFPGNMVINRKDYPIPLIALTVKKSRELCDYAAETIDSVLETEDDESDFELLPGRKSVDSGTLLTCTEDFNLQEANEVSDLIDTALRERERDIIRLYYGLDDESLTWEEISKRMGLSRERVRQIGLTAVEKLKHAARKRRMEALLVKH